MERIRRVAVFGLLLGALLVANAVVVSSALAKCCDLTNDGCNSASEQGCAMGSPLDMFFDDPCVCQNGACVITQTAQPCGGGANGDCGDGNLDSGEECDDGTSNGTFNSCCATDCSFKADGALCDDGIFCDGLGACNGENTCLENEGGPTCADPETCDEDSRSCQTAQAPTVSMGLLVALAITMLAGAVLTMRQRRHRPGI